MSRYIDADKLKDNFCDACATLKRYGRTVEECRNKTDSYGNKCFKMRLIDAIPTADAVEVRHDFNVGDFCLYGFADGNKSLAIVEIVKILDDERGIAELKFHKVIKDNTGNGYFHYLFKSGHTMNGSFGYLRNITPKSDGERREE